MWGGSRAFVFGPFFRILSFDRALNLRGPPIFLRLGEGIRKDFLDQLLSTYQACNHPSSRQTNG